jgi:hypothetical protein
MDTESRDEIIKSLDVSGWTLSDERELVENLYVGRFNYFLIVFSLFITAGFANTFQEFKSMVFYVGAFVLFLIWLLLYRGYKKHDRIMRIIFNNTKDHPAAKIESVMKIEGYKPRYKVSKLMGVYIPWVCISFLLAIAIFVNCGVLK